MTILHDTPLSPATTAPSPRSHFVHVPTPGDHYSPATGSAVITIIHDLARSHGAHNFPTSVIVANGTTAGYPPYPAGQLLQADLPLALPSKPKRIADAALARLLLARPFSARLYANVPSTLPHRFQGTLFIHNSPAPIPLLRRGLPKARLVLYVHNQLFNTYSAREIRRILDHADAVICVSHFLANDLAARAHCPSKKIMVVHNGVDTDAFVPATSPPGGVPTILFVGRMLPEKGPDLLLKAAVKIASPQRPFKLRLVGSQNFNAKDPLTPYEQTLRTLAAPIADRVEFLPFAPRHLIPDLYRQAALFVAPSSWDEPFGLTVAEALASGLPTIASKKGGIPEAAADAALYFSPPNTDELAAQLATLLDNPTLRSHYAAKARARALQLSWSQQYAALIKALKPY